MRRGSLAAKAHKAQTRRSRRAVQTTLAGTSPSSKPIMAAFAVSLRKTRVVGARGFEPSAPSSRTRCATRPRYTPPRCRTSLRGRFLRDSYNSCGVLKQTDVKAWDYLISSISRMGRQAMGGKAARSRVAHPSRRPNSARLDKGEAFAGSQETGVPYDYFSHSGTGAGGSF